MVHLPPVLWDELESFGVTLPRRLFHGGLPPALLAESKNPSFYREWMDSFFARDIQRLFGFRDMPARLSKRTMFNLSDIVRCVKLRFCLLSRFCGNGFAFGHYLGGAIWLRSRGGRGTGAADDGGVFQEAGKREAHAT